MTTGQRIKAARKKAGMTQKELGEKLSITYQTIAQWENDLRNPKLETLQRIATALGVSIYELTDNNDLKRAVLYGERLGGDSDGQDDSSEIQSHIAFDGLHSHVWLSGDAPDTHTHTWQFKNEGVVHKEPLHLIDIVEYEITANEIEELLDKLQDDEALFLSPDELAKFKSLPKEQIAAALDEQEEREQEERHAIIAALKAQMEKMRQRYGPDAFPEFDKLGPLLYKFQSGEITQSEKDQIKKLLATAQARLKAYNEAAPPPQASEMEAHSMGGGSSRLCISAAPYADTEAGRRFIETEKELVKSFAEGRMAHGKSKYINAILKDPQRRIAAALGKLNEEGQEKAAERVEELTEIPRYRATDAPQSTPPAEEGTDTTPAEIPPEVLQEPPKKRIQTVTMICPICGKRFPALNDKKENRLCYTCRHRYKDTLSKK